MSTRLLGPRRQKSLLGLDLKGLGGPVLALLAAGPVLWLTFRRLLVPRTAPTSKPAPSPA
jgi:hypothetical protein